MADLETMFETAGCGCNCYLCVGSVHERCSTDKCCPLTEEELHDGAYMEGFSDAARDYDKIVDRVFAYCVDENDCDELKVQKILQDMIIIMSFR